ncbi:MAG: phytanoyl-CoA dioxygenase family protein [Stackebrandtia sp.]
MIHTSRSELSAADRAFYEKNGYLTVDGLLPDDEFQALKSHFEAKLAALTSEQRPENMDVPHFTDPAIFRWLFNEKVLDMVEKLIGRDIALFSSHFFCKRARDGKSVPWHQDAYYWRETILPASDAITVWLAIDPSTAANGCMQVIPGSHRSDGMRYRDLEDEQSVFDEELDPAHVDAGSAVPVELRPNQCSIHSALTVHGSDPNLSPMRRCGFTMRYMPTTVRLNQEVAGGKHQVYLARGEDKAGNSYADPTRAYFDLMEERGSGQSYIGENKGQSNPM